MEPSARMRLLIKSVPGRHMRENPPGLLRQLSSVESQGSDIPCRTIR